MKVLFAVSSEKISELVINKYQKLNNEVLIYKNLYYYNSVIKELETVKDYDVIVLDENLEEISNDKHDRNLISILDKITDIAINKHEQIIPVILITRENRYFGENFLEQLFKIGIYNALIGKDRKITNVCNLLKKPRTLQEAKAYYNINIAEKETVLSEEEGAIPKIQLKSILDFYQKNIEKVNKYSEIFNKIATQYNDLELKYILSKLPIQVQTVLKKENEIVKRFNNTENLKVESNITLKQEDIVPKIETKQPIEKQTIVKEEQEEKEKEKFVQPVQTTNNAYRVDYSKASLNYQNKKAVIFVGTTKNGVSFLVNTIAILFSKLGINTAILDVTKNKNSYYMSTNSDERLKQIAQISILKLDKGIAQGIQVDNNLTVYTSVPGGMKLDVSPYNVINTLYKNHTVILIDSDFETELEYFQLAKEIYLVQSLDILTIQPLTEFLKGLKVRNILTDEKINIVLNKEVGVRGLTKKQIVGGISMYNSPTMQERISLFNRENVNVFSIPFNLIAYQKYLEQIIQCKFELAGYPKKFIEEIKLLAHNIYPLVSRGNNI